jgi:uncharacterized protein (TIGR03000 family)
MKRILALGVASTLALVMTAGSSFAQFHFNPYLQPGYGYYPGEAKMGVMPGNRVQYYPQYYSSAYQYGYYPPMGTYDHTPNITGFLSTPITGSYVGQDGYHTPSQQSMSFYFTPSVDRSNAHPNAAAIDVMVSPNAKLWVDGVETRQQGTARFFESPPLVPGKTYTYDVKAVWMDENGKKVERHRTIEVQAGSHVTVDFHNAQS